MEKLIFADDHQKIELDVNPEELKSIPFFQGYLSDYFSKGIIHVPNALTSASLIMEYLDGFKSIYHKLTCSDYFGMKPNLNILEGVYVPSNQFELLLELTNHFGYDPILVDTIYRNLPSDYRLPNELALLLMEQYSKKLIHIIRNRCHQIYDLGTNKYIHQFGDKYLRKHIVDGWLLFDERILFISQNIFVMDDCEHIYVFDISAEIIMYKIGFEHNEFNYYGISFDKKILWIVYPDHIAFHNTVDGKIFKKIMISINNIELSHVSKWILVLKKNIFKIIDIESEEVIKEFKFSFEVQDMKLSYDDRLLAVQEEERSNAVRIIKLDTQEEIFRVENTSDFDFSTDSKKIFITTILSKRNNLYVYDIYGQTMIASIDHPKITTKPFDFEFPQFISSKELVFGYGKHIYLYNIDEKIHKLIGYIGKGTMRTYIMPCPKIIT